MKRKKFVTITQFMSERAHGRGFTLVELMIVILIIGILVAVAVPILLNNRKKADQVTAEYNLKAGAQCMDRIWMKLTDHGRPPDGIESYRDWDPPAALKGESDYITNGWAPIQAQYMSQLETRIYWVDLTVGDGGQPLASNDLSGLHGLQAAASGTGFRLDNIWYNGVSQGSGPAVSNNWGLLPGKIGILQNQYYYEGGWQPNTDNYCLTLVTLEHSGIAHYITLKQATVLDYGRFEWKDGAGNPGEGWKEDTDHPPAATNPAPPATQPNPGPGDNPPPASEPNPGPGDNPPPATNPEPPATDPQPPASNPTPPWDEPGFPPGPNLVSSIRIEPETLNINSNGKFTAFISMLSGYNAGDLNISSLMVWGANPISSHIDSNGSITLQLKFDRKDLDNVPIGSHVMFLITGHYNDGTAFQGWDYITVIE
jgi:prepilin-type N-terminal cleavage/methylation domain-containing protein